MEEPVEVKDSVTGAVEPIKLEAPVPNPDSSDRSDGVVSPPPNCSICLGKLVNTSFTDSCLHQFCFTCLLQWSKIKTECPLCKQTFKSIIHNVRSEEDYDQYHVPRELTTLDLNLEFGHTMDTSGTTHRFQYRTTMTSDHHRFHRMRDLVHDLLLRPTEQQLTRRGHLPGALYHVPIGELQRRRANPTDYRRTIYRLGVWATGLPDCLVGRFRGSSADFYRREQRELNRLIPWLNRELQVLLNNNAAHITYVMRGILEALVQYDIRSSQFRDVVLRYFGEFTDHFIHEFINFARTNFDLAGYDQSVTYLPQGLSNEYVSSVLSPTSSSTSTTSDDSDIRVLEEAIDLRMNAELPIVGPHTMNMPGPSTVAQAFQVDVMYETPDILTISSDSSSSDNECEVVGYVKPRHERTPEIIELVSSDSEEVNISPASTDNAQAPIPSAPTSLCEDVTQPGTSHTVKKWELLSSTSTESDTDSGGNYIYRKNRKYQCVGRTYDQKRYKVDKKRIKPIEIRVRNRTRKISSSGESDNRKKPTKRNNQRSVKRRTSSSSSGSSSSSSSSDISSREIESKSTEEKKSRTSQYSTNSSSCYRKNSINKESRYSDNKFSSDDSSSDSEEKNKSRLSRKSKRKYTSERVTRMKVKTRQSSEVKDSHRKESRYKDDRESASRSNSTSSYSSQKSRRVVSWRRDSSDDDASWKSRSAARKDRACASKSRDTSSSDEDYRSHSQCSNYSSKSYTHKKKSKHKDRHKSRKRKRSNSRNRGSNKSRSTRRHPA